MADASVITLVKSSMDNLTAVAVNAFPTSRSSEVSMFGPNPALNAKVDEQRIRERAYVLWEEADCPEGHADEFWSLAQQEILKQEVAYDETLKEGFPASDSLAGTARLRPRRAVSAKLR